MMAASFRVRSTTIMLATEPVMVRFPARVLAIASVSQPERGLAKWLTSDFQKHYGRNVAHQVRQNCGHQCKDPRMFQVEVTAEPQHLTFRSIGCDFKALVVSFDKDCLGTRTCVLDFTFFLRDHGGLVRPKFL